MNADTVIDFHGAEINLSREYCEARRLMGLKTTDLDWLYEKVAQVYLNIRDDEWSQAYLNLMDEIQLRQRMLLVG